MCGVSEAGGDDCSCYTVQVKRAKKAPRLRKPCHPDRWGTACLSQEMHGWMRAAMLLSATCSSRVHRGFTQQAALCSPGWQLLCSPVWAVSS